MSNEDKDTNGPQPSTPEPADKTKKPSKLQIRVQAQMKGFKRFLSPKEIFMILSLVFMVWALITVMNFTKNDLLSGPVRIGKPSTPTPTPLYIPQLIRTEEATTSPLETPTPTPPEIEDTEGLRQAFDFLKKADINAFSEKDLTPPDYDTLLQSTSDYNRTIFRLNGRVENVSLIAVAFENEETSLPAWRGELMDFDGQIWSFVTPVVQIEMKRGSYITINAIRYGKVLRKGYRDTSINAVVSNGYELYRFSFDPSLMDSYLGDKIIDWPRPKYIDPQMLVFHCKIEWDSLYYLLAMLQNTSLEDLNKMRNPALNFVRLMSDNPDKFRGAYIPAKGSVKSVAVQELNANFSGVNTVYNIIIQDRQHNLWALRMIVSDAERLPRVGETIAVDGLFMKIWAYRTQHKDRVQYNHLPLLVCKNFKTVIEDYSTPWYIYLGSVLLLVAFLVVLLLMMRVFRKDQKAKDSLRNKIILKHRQPKEGEPVTEGEENATSSEQISTEEPKLDNAEPPSDAETAPPPASPTTEEPKTDDAEPPASEDVPPPEKK